MQSFQKKKELLSMMHFMIICSKALFIIAKLLSSKFFKGKRASCKWCMGLVCPHKTPLKPPQWPIVYSTWQIALWWKWWSWCGDDSDDEELNSIEELNKRDHEDGDICRRKEWEWGGYCLWPVYSTANHTSYLSQTPQTCLCKKKLPGVNFYRFNAKKWRFLQI